ncbi:MULTISPECIES: translation initiation factor IF-2 [unclassified Desulfovibrio]|uniref:translation initiation factor IF-2 n=1 Tax=unclassified Desulfovibrio TaxID=2593640 RepID=UPI000F5F7A47|nr:MULTISPECIES: translation initiation factor IF-2 [unclassified Desulfovibrio]RRD70389.1 translation initiation factor IF-2 [Desulfovibrio sp. OH1209_COT-279]RRD86867.1 translation initiation factor IF-2 [Desulfovibrio sp. OH1186_COT-070]
MRILHRLFTAALAAVLAVLTAGHGPWAAPPSGEAPPLPPPLPLASPASATAACPAADLPPEQARICAGSAALLAALRTAARALPPSAEIRMNLPEEGQRMALAAQLYTPLVRHQGKECTVTLLARPHARQTLSENLRAPQLLAARLHLLRATEKLLAEAAALPPPVPGGIWLRLAARPPGTPRQPPEESLADHLEALGLAQDALCRSDIGWLTTPAFLPVLEQAVRKLTDNALLFLLLAEAQLQRDMPLQCAASCTQALRLDPAMSRARYIRSLAHWRLQQPALAEQDLTASLEDTLPDLEKARRLRARGALRLLRRADAEMCRDFAEACALGDCEGMVQARSRGLCLPNSENTPRRSMEERP